MKHWYQLQPAVGGRRRQPQEESHGRKEIPDEGQGQEEALQVGTQPKAQPGAGFALARKRAESRLAAVARTKAKHGNLRGNTEPDQSGLPEPD